jgi:hypothetical protein
MKKLFLCFIFFTSASLSATGKPSFGLSDFCDKTLDRNPRPQAGLQALLHWKQNPLCPTTTVGSDAPSLSEAFAIKTAWYYSLVSDWRRIKSQPWLLAHVQEVYKIWIVEHLIPPSLLPPREERRMFYLLAIGNPKLLSPRKQPHERCDGISWFRKDFALGDKKR